MALARINYSTFAARKGKTLTCEGCRQPIEKGSRYQWFKVGFRSRYVHTYHMGCTVRLSARASGKMAGIYSGIENAQDTLAGLSFSVGDDAGSFVQSVQDALNTAADEWEYVADEYREAAEASPTGYVFGVDLNDAADSVEDAMRELQDWSPDDEEPDYEACTNEEHDDEEREGGPLERGTSDCDECESIALDWAQEVTSGAESILDDASSNIEVGM